MKKIVFFQREITSLSNNSLLAAKKLNIKLDIFTYNQVALKTENNKLAVKINGKKLDKYDLAYFRNVGQFLETQVLLSEYFLEKGTQVFDPALCYAKPFIDRKSFEYLKLSQKNLPIINSLVVSKESCEIFRKEISFPCIAKTTDGKQGEGTFLCANHDDIRKVFETHEGRVIIQPFIKNNGDLRIIVIGNRAIGAIKRVAKKDEYRNNISLGGKAIKYKLNKEEENIAVNASKALNYSIAGVDLIFDNESKKWKIIEVNRGPQVDGFIKATGINVRMEILKFLGDQIK